jgi:outer membrane biosynthesis protein TonB
MTRNDVATRVLFRYLCAQAISKVSKDFPSEQALNQYLQEHPKADKAKHKVVEHSDGGGHEFDDAKDVAATLSSHWKAHASEGDPVSKLIDALAKGSPVSAASLNAALKSAEGKSKTVEYTIRDLLDEIEDEPAKPAQKPKPAPKPKPEAKPAPKPEAKPEPESSKPESEPERKSKTKPEEGAAKARKGSKLSLPKPDAALIKKLDSAVSSSKPKKRIQPGSPSHVARLLQAAGASPEVVEKAEKWSEKWVYGGAESGKMDASKDAIADFTKALEKPNSWARMKYEATQATIRADMKRLQKEGIMDAEGYVTLYRGVRGKQAKSLKGQSEVDLEVRGLSSWSDSAKCANKFSDENQVVLATKIHYTRVAGMWSSEGYYWTGKDEHEWSIISDGKSEPATILKESK